MIKLSRIPAHFLLVLALLVQVTAAHAHPGLCDRDYALNEKGFRNMLGDIVEASDPIAVHAPRIGGTHGLLSRIARLAGLTPEERVAIDRALRPRFAAALAADIRPGIAQEVHSTQTILSTLDDAALHSELRELVASARANQLMTAFTNFVDDSQLSLNRGQRAMIMEVLASYRASVLKATSAQSVSAWISLLREHGWTQRD